MLANQKSRRKSKQKPCSNCVAGQESKLVAVIACTDQRLRPRHTKLYVASSVGLCLLVSVLVLFFLFPRSVVLSPVAVSSSSVYFTHDGVQINITNVLNITNNNFAAVQAYNLTVQALNFGTVLGTVSIKNVVSVRPLSMKTVRCDAVTTAEEGAHTCPSSLPVHILYVNLQISLTVFCLARYEQLSLETYEYIDCGANNTVPHSLLDRHFLSTSPIKLCEPV
uniref:Transmembrane protein 106B-like n=1 Tax=Pundamilia nyererei TaxID=303518 RepID=A0A3B4EZN6_9CICH